MTDIRSPQLLVAKGILFVVLGSLSGGLLLAEQLTLRTALLLALTVWAFCRAYYFAFYVIQHYIDPSYKFAGLSSVVWYLWQKRHGSR